MSDETSFDHYRLYWIGVGGQVDAVSEPIRARNDDDALDEAHALAAGDHVELWMGLRFVARLGATAQPLARREVALPSMTRAERVKLIDAAFRSGRPVAFLAGVQAAFEDAGRQGDALLTTNLASLHRSGEIEALMFMRSRWLDGFGVRGPRPTSSP